LETHAEYGIIKKTQSIRTQTMTEPQSDPTWTQPLIHLVFASAELPLISKATQTARVTSAANIKPEALSLEWAEQDAQRCLGMARIGPHTLFIVGMAAPLPADVMDRTVMVSPWGAQIKAAMRQHRAHISLVYAKGHADPVEQMIALYSLASAFETEDLLGILNPNAWNAHPPADFLSPTKLAQYRREIPFNLWVGYVRFYTDDQSFWLVTKGHHVFDVPDLAYFIEAGQDPDVVITLFTNLFYYLYENDVFVTAGDTLEIQGTGQQLQFSQVTELIDDLMGPSGTLVITQAESPN
jgi:hypothetical protein